MVLKMIDVKDAQVHLDDLVREAAAGAEVILTKDDLPVARIVPVSVPVSNGPRIPGLNPGAFQPGPDFDDPLPEDFLLRGE